MKPTELKSLLEGHTKLGEKIASLETLQLTASADLESLEASADLQDQAALDKIGRLQVQVNLIPLRIAALAADHETSRVQLLAAAEVFVEKTLRAKIKAVRAAAAAKAGAALGSLYSGQKLINAINESDVVASLDQISRVLQPENDPSFPLDYVARRMAILEQLAKIEKAL